MSTSFPPSISKNLFLQKCHEIQKLRYKYFLIFKSITNNFATVIQWFVIILFYVLVTENTTPTTTPTSTTTTSTSTTGNLKNTSNFVSLYFLNLFVAKHSLYKELFYQKLNKSYKNSKQKFP